MSHRELFRAEQLPVLQNKMFSTAEEAVVCTKGDVVLVQYMESGMVFNSAFDPELLDYSDDYQNEQACSAVFQAHLHAATVIVDRYFQGKTLIEVGCGKGYFLKHLRESGYVITGIDPAYEGTSPHIVKARFEMGLGLSSEGVVLRHVLEHMRDPIEFLSRIASANGGKGLIYIEVPCFDWICRHRALFDVFYEHVNYFRLADFTRIFGAVLESGHLFGGQYLYAVADLATLHSPHATARDAIDFPQDFIAGVGRHICSREARSTESRSQQAIWGGASKGVIFALYMKRAGVVIDCVIDINPAKQGKYLAASGVRVSSPQEALALLQPETDVFVMNSNYLNEIVVQSNNRFRYLTVEHDEL